MRKFRGKASRLNISNGGRDLAVRSELARARRLWARVGADPEADLHRLDLVGQRCWHPACRVPAPSPSSILCPQHARALRLEATDGAAVV